MRSHMVLRGCLMVGLMAVSWPAFAGERKDAAKPSGTTDEPSALETLPVVSWKAVQERVARQKGKVVAVTLWTTTCGACLAELPKFAALRKTFSENEVALCTVACDYDGIREKPPEFYRKKVSQSLREAGAERLENFLLDVPFVDFLEQQKLRSTPAVLVFGANGELLCRFDNDKARTSSEEFTMDEVAARIREAFAAARSPSR